MLKQIDDSLAKFLNIEIPKEDLYQAEEYFLGDDGKSYGKQTPYIKAEQWYCCGKPLEKNGNTYVCSVCHSRYGA